MTYANLALKANNTSMATLVETDRILLDPSLTSDWRIRSVVKDKIERASLTLPDGLYLMIFEAYRSAERQQEMWDEVYHNVQLLNPSFDEQQIYTQTATWISPPDGFGSGHLSGAAIDITLATSRSNLLDMGTDIQEFSLLTPTQSDVQPQIKDNRNLLVSCLASQGLINYPSEWWHFSYGDRLWAELTDRNYLYFTPHNL